MFHPARSYLPRRSSSNRLRTLVNNTQMPDLTITLTVGVAGIVLGIVRLAVRGYRSRAGTRWKKAESSVKQTRRRVHELWTDVNGMAGNRDDVFVELGKAVPALQKVEDAIVAARRLCEDIDREREQRSITEDLASGLDADGNTSRLGVVWKLVEDNLEPRDKEQS